MDIYIPLTNYDSSSYVMEHMVFNLLVTECTKNEYVSRIYCTSYVKVSRFIHSCAGCCQAKKDLTPGPWRGRPQLANVYDAWGPAIVLVKNARLYKVTLVPRGARIQNP